MPSSFEKFIVENAEAEVPRLLLSSVQWPVPDDPDLSAFDGKQLAISTIESRKKLRDKVPEWYSITSLVYPASVSAEQCSSSVTAAYKASLLARILEGASSKSVADLTGGLGIDTFYISQHFRQTDYVEMQTELCDLARHNFAILKADVKVLNETAEDYLKRCEPKDCIFIDPARRDEHGRKTISISDCTPDVAALQDLLRQKAKRVLIKLSPMLDISKALEELCHVKEVHVVAVANECKELDFIMERDYQGEVHFVCVNLMTNQQELCFTMAEERSSTTRLADGVMKYLYEPNPALMKAGCFKLLTARFDVYKLHKNSNLYTSEQLIPDFPGRVFEVQDWAPYHKKVKSTLLADVEKASVAVRNFPLSVAELRKNLKIADGDENYVFVTTLKGEEKIIILTKKAASDEAAH